MPATKSASQATQKAKTSTRKAAGSAKETAGKAVDTAVETADKAKASTKKAVAGARATRAAKAGMVEDARQITEEAGAQGAAADAIAEADAMHYQAVVNKRGLSVSALTTTLNERWANGWRLAHAFEQRGNTVLVFEMRS